MKKENISWFIFGVNIILLGAIFFLNTSHIVITSESIVLSFVGILATFIVVSNYAQVIDIKNSTDNQIKKLEGNTQEMIEELYDNTQDIMNELQLKHKEIELIANELNNSKIDINLLNGIVYLIYGQFQLATHYFLETIFTGSNKLQDEDIIKFMNLTLLCLESSNWNKEGQDEDTFDYDDHINKCEELLPPRFTQKDEIISLLEGYRDRQVTISGLYSSKH